MASKLDDVFLDHIDDLKTHEGHRIIQEHIKAEQQRVANAIVTQQSEDRETQFKRGFYAGLNFALNATKQVRELRIAEIESEQPSTKKRRA